MSKTEIPIRWELSPEEIRLKKMLRDTLATLEGKSYSSTAISDILSSKCPEYYQYYGEFPFKINFRTSEDRVYFYENVLVQAYPRYKLRDSEDYQVITTIGKPGQPREEVQSLQLEWLRSEFPNVYVDDQERIYGKWLKNIPASTQDKIESEIHNHPEVLKAKMQLTKLNDELDNVRRGLAENLLWRETQNELLLKKYNLVQYDQHTKEIDKIKEIKVHSAQTGNLTGIHAVEREIGTFARATTKTALITEAIAEHEEATRKIKELYKDSLEAYWPKKIALESLVDKKKITLTQKLSQVEEKFRKFNNSILLAVIDIKLELMSKYQIVTDDPEIMEL